LTGGPHDGPEIDHGSTAAGAGVCREECGPSRFKKILIGALATLFIGFIVQIWKYRRDAYAARVDEFCKMIFEAADLGAEYWTTKKNSKLDAASSEKVRLAEAKLDGFQRKINLFSVILRGFVRVSDSDKTSLLIADFFDALTGGNFGADTRARDEGRARLVYATAADLVAHLRTTAPQPSWITILLGLAAALAILLLFILPS
jgi:hypothetical protein